MGKSSKSSNDDLHFGGEAISAPGGTGARPMVDRVTQYISDGDPPAKPAEADAPEVTPARVLLSDRQDLVRADQLRSLSLPNQSLGGYRHGEVDDLLDRAAASIEQLEQTNARLKR